MRNLEGHGQRWKGNDIHAGDFIYFRTSHPSAKGQQQGKAGVDVNPKESQPPSGGEKTKDIYRAAGKASRAPFGSVCLLGPESKANSLNTRLSSSWAPREKTSED